MSDMGLPALALRTDYIANAGWDGMRQGRQDRIADEERNLLKQVGGIAATGNYLDASRAAMAGGNVKLGQDIANWDMDRKSKAYEFLLNGVQRADTPEKYQTLVDMVTKNFGPEMVRGYETFDKRPNALTTLQEATRALETRKAESQIALQESTARLHDAQAEAARRKPNTIEQVMGMFRRPEGQAPVQGQQSSVAPQSDGGASVVAGGTTTPMPGVSVTQPSTGGSVVTGGQGQSAIPGQNPPATHPADLIDRMSVGQRTAFMMHLMKEDFDGASKILREMEAGPFKDPKQLADVEEGMRKELSTLAKPFIEVRDAYRRIENVGQNPSPAGDIALIFNFMKMLDPGSTVREGEFATAQNAAGVPDQVVNLYNRIINGYRLNETQRDDFSGHARRLYKTQESQYNQTVQNFKDIAGRKGLDPRNIILDQSSEPSVQPPSMVSRIPRMTLKDLEALDTSKMSPEELMAAEARYKQLGGEAAEKARRPNWDHGGR